MYTRFNRLLPHGVYISDEINEFIKQRVLDFENESKETKPNKSPVIIHENNVVKHNSMLEQATEPTLNIYCTTQDLVSHVRRITDPQIAWALKRNAKLLSGLAETKAKELQKEHRL